MLDLNKGFNENLLRFGTGPHRLILAFLFIAIRTPRLSRATPRRSWTPVWPRREREALTIILSVQSIRGMTVIDEHYSNQLIKTLCKNIRKRFHGPGTESRDHGPVSDYG